MNKVKRFLIFAITVVIIACNVNFVQATDKQDESNYLDSVLYAYLAANGIEVDGIAISSAVPVQMLDNSDVENIYFLKRNHEILAKLAVTSRAGTYYSCFDMDVKEINDIYQEDLTIALVKKRNTIFALMGSTQITLYKNPYESVILSQADKSIIKKEKITFIKELSQTFQARNGSEYIKLDASIASSPEVGGLLNVTRVPNVTIGGAGQCWAASTAAMLNYKNGTSLTAPDIYNKCLNSGFVGTYGTPCGSIEWVRKVYSLYGVSIVDQTGGIIYARIYSLLSSNKPVQMDYYSSSGTGHTVVLCGSYYDGNTLVYTFRDPNKSSTVSVTQSLSAATNASFIKYNDGSTLYDECTHTYYY
jgi:staphopain A